MNLLIFHLAWLSLRYGADLLPFLLFSMWYYILQKVLFPKINIYNYCQKIMHLGQIA